ncbi:MAG: flagellar motor protein MotB [Acetobacteraceae bacterium]
MRPKRGKQGDRKGGSLIIRRVEAAAHAHHGGAWKVAYADFVTAMMAFFLLLWLLNATTEDQRKGLADYFSPTNLLSHNSSGTGKPFGGHTAFDQGALVSDRGSVQITVGHRPVLETPAEVADKAQQSSTARSTPATGQHGQPLQAGTETGPANASGSTPPLRATPPYPMGEPAASAAVVRPVLPVTSGGHANASSTTELAQPTPAKSDSAAMAAARESQALSSAADEIRQAVRNDPTLAGLVKHLSVDITPEGLRIQLLDTQNQSMFAFGSAVPNETARLLLDKIAPVLIRLPEQVSIAGHTDAAPYAGHGMTNWELSAERANAARRMLAEAGFPEQRLRDVSGHADRQLLLPADPLAPANRRIAILVLRNTGTASGRPSLKPPSATDPQTSFP